MRTVNLPVLNRLNLKSLLTQTLQSVEELGEVAQNVNLLMGISGKHKPVPENIVELTGEELFDALQSLVGCLAVLERDYGFDINQGWNLHLAKMLERGYLSNE